jgi:hypothetical protein
MEEVHSSCARSFSPLKISSLDCCEAVNRVIISFVCCLQ